jgi:hypothetical protein
MSVAVITYNRGMSRWEPREIYVSAIAAAPDSAAPIEAVTAALQAAVPMFAERHERARQRQAVIAANPGLQERELLKRASLMTAGR